MLPVKAGPEGPSGPVAPSLEQEFNTITADAIIHDENKKCFFIDLSLVCKAKLWNGLNYQRFIR